MKKLSFLLFAILCVHFLLYGQWTVKDPGLVGHYEINHVHSVTENNVWICAKDQSENHSGPMFSHSENGGETWESGYITLNDHLAPAMIFGFDVFPFAFAAVYSTVDNSNGFQGIHATFDGGQSWQRQSGAFENPAAWPDIVYFWNTTWGIAIGDPVDGYFDIYTTNDLGTTWQKLPQANIPDPLPGENAIVGTFDVKDHTIWFSTTKGRVYCSEDYGINWMVSSSPFSSFTKVVFKDQNNGWLQDVGSWESTQIARTTNGGLDWELISHTGPLLNWDIDYIPGTTSTLISSGAYLNNGISASYNDGNTWYWLEEPGTKFFKMDWFDWQHGWVGGYDDVQQRAMVYVYSGQGIGEFLVNPQFLDFGNVTIGTTVSQNITVTNVGSETLELINIWGNNGFFQINPTNGFIDPDGGTFNIELSFSPGMDAYYGEIITIETSSPVIPEAMVFVQGNGIIPVNSMTFDPESFNETLYTGQTATQTLTVTNNSDTDINYEASVDCELSLGSLGWNYASTPLGCDDGILCGGADQAMFIKEFSLEEFNTANLFLGYDDGIRCWVNGTLVFDDLHGDNGLSYWNQEIDITSYLHSGKNRVSTIVFNGLFGGCCEGEFDCQLTVDGVDVIKRGDENYGTPEAIWFYFGESGQQFVPGMDVNGKNWWEAGYGQYDWVLLGLEQQAEQNLESLGWSYQSAPFTGDGLLSNAPDNAQFIKDIEVVDYSWATLYLGFDDGCRVWINGNLIFDYYDEVHGLNYWDHEEDISGLLEIGRNRISVEVYNGVYGGGGWGGFDCQLIIDDELAVIKRGDENFGEPEAMWYVFGIGGQVLTPPEDGAGNVWTDMNYGLPGAQQSVCLTDLNWNFDSTPFYERPDLLNTPPDNAQFIKDFTVDEYSWATLFLGFDDGCRVWMNGNLVFDFHDEVHGLSYWDHEEDITGLIQIGRNRISVEVYNGIYGGGAFGGFDCQLIVDDVAVIKRGDENPGQPEAMWYYYGQAGQILTPPDDENGLTWTDMDYGLCQDAYSTSLSGSIASGTTQQIQVKINAAGLNTGDYSTNIVFTSETAEQETTIPVNLFVNAESHLTTVPSVINFGDYYIGYPETITVTLKNDGFEYLDVISIWSYSADIYSDYTGCYLAPGESFLITVTLDSYDVGTFNSTLYFETLSYSSITTAVPIVANRMEAPSLVIENLDYMYSYLASGQLDNQNLHIDNWGGSPLTFTLPQAINQIAVTDQEKTHSQHIFKPETKIAREVARDKQPEYYNTDITQTINLVKDEKLYLQSKEAFSSVEIFSDDMENGTDGWTVENYLEGSSKWHQVKFNSNSSETSWWCGDESSGTYYDGYHVQQAIISPSIKLPDIECTITLNFFEWYSIEDGYDQCFIDVSTNDGYDWVRVRDYNPGFSDGWINTTIDLSMFYGSEIKIRFFFDTGDEAANDFPGWFVDDVKIFFHVWDFLNISPSGGIIFANEGADIDVTFNAVDYSEGLYLSMLLFRTNDPEHEWFYLPAYMDVWGGAVTHQIFLPTGWSGLSSYIIPAAPALEDVFAPISNELIIAQTMTEMYVPGENINTIGNWESQSAYKVKTSAECTLPITGNYETNMAVMLNSGWSLLPVITTNGADPSSLFSPVDGFIVAKDVAGTGVFWPQFNINSIGYLLPGNAYYVLLTSPGVVDYTGMKSSVNLTGFKNLSGLEIKPTPSSHTIAILPSALKDIEVGTIIGAYDQNDNCFGITSIVKEANHLTIFGDDPTTVEKDGFIEGEMIFFKNLSGYENLSGFKNLTGLKATFDQNLPQSDGLFTENGLSAILGFESIIGIGNENSDHVVQVYPNPSDGKINIIGLEVNAEIIISDAKGQIVMDGIIPESNTMTIDLSNLKPGIYFIKIPKNGEIIFRKILLR